jgi:two-component system sensor histidine kinase BaeS
MSEPGAAESHQPRLGPVGWRLLASFLLVSLVSLVVLVVLSMWGVRGGLSSLEVEEHNTAAVTAAADVATAYSRAGGWSGIDLAAARATAHAAGGRLSLYDAAGTQLAGPPAGEPAGPGLTPSKAAPTASAAVVVDGATVGRVELSFLSDVPFLVSSRSLVLWWVLASAALGLLAAGLVGLWISGRLLRPLRRLTTAATRFAAGDHSARAGHHDLPGVLGGLSQAVDHMADSVVAHEAASRQVVADVAHELRNPLTSLQAGLEELTDGLAEPTPGRLAALHDQSLRLSRVIEDLDLLASVESGRPTLRRAACDLAEIAAGTLDVKDTQLRTSELVVFRDLDSAMVDVDPDRMHQVVGNLLDNVIRYCLPGDQVRVRTRTLDGRAVLSVEDSGPGIADADLPHVQQRLYRGQNATSVVGSGIGLTVVRELVEAHNGSVEVGPGMDGRGTRVQVSLPAL